MKNNSKCRISVVLFVKANGVATFEAGHDNGWIQSATERLDGFARTRDGSEYVI